MNALLLAAGVGRRLGDLANHGPKCLLPMGKDHLLGRTLDTLAALGIETTTIVVGHFAEKVKAAAGDRRGRMSIRYVLNPHFREGSIVSLWYARAALSADVLVMDADVLFPRALLQRLTECSHSSCILLDGRVSGDGEEMILFAAQGRVWDIVRRAKGHTPQPPRGVEAFDTTGESVGFIKVGNQDASQLRLVVERRVAGGVRDCDHELTYPEFFRSCAVGYERVDDLPWMEVDFPEDLARARREVLPLVDQMKAPL